MKHIIHLRNLKLEDSEALFNFYSNEEAMKYRNSKTMQSLTDAEDFILNQYNREKNILTIRKGAELSNSGTLIGTVMFKYDILSKSECEIGYSLGKQFWSQGFGTEIVKVMLIELGSHSNIETIIAWCSQKNTASLKILGKFGFRLTENLNSSEHSSYLRYLKSNRR